MPFISKDWRSPGEAWVKTDEGWERLKVLECGKRKRTNTDDRYDSDDNNENNSNSSSNSTSSVGSSNNDNDNLSGSGGAGGAGGASVGNESDIIPPHCHITIRCTREIAGFNGLSEVVRRLDFRSSVRDRRRFHYICALLRLLVTHKGIANLPGSAQRQLLQMVEEVAAHVNDSQQHFNVVRGLAKQLQNIVYQENQKCWGKPLGSTYLWQEHVETIKRIQTIASQMRIHEPSVDLRPQLHEMPEECVREILLRIADHRDLEAAAGAWQIMAALVQEQRIWRELTRFHFNEQQIKTILETKKFKQAAKATATAAAAAAGAGATADVVKDWKKIYHQLRRTYGVKEDYQYAEVLSLCRSCCCLFWPSDGHPCIVDQSPEYKQRVVEAGGQLALAQPVPPAAFLKFFSL